MSSRPADDARVIPLRRETGRAETSAPVSAPVPREPLWRDLVGDVLRRERRAQQRTLKDVADAARISLPYLSEIERGRKEASSEVLAAAAQALGLGLGELLTRVHSELLTRVQGERTGQRAAGRNPSAAPARGMCLAA
ncbi:helix-turn-helix domain-containing protein [Streptomyces sp. NPDC056161]|uniref:helix-turn-helix domain-containing protein n=1 Tax=Streptomyces sp. NPDC056161 TaxID=3345732 RepID=UPI0035E09DC7